jgi:hypothetical protein
VARQAAFWLAVAMAALVACGGGTGSGDDAAASRDVVADEGSADGLDAADPTARDLPMDARPEAADPAGDPVPGDDAPPDAPPDAPGDLPGDAGDGMAGDLDDTATDADAAGGDTPADAPPDAPPDPGLAPVREATSRDGYGGVTDLPVDNLSGFFRPALLGDRWVLATPAGNALLSLGLTTVDFGGDVGRGMDYSSWSLSNRAAWGDGDDARSAWCGQALQDLRAAGFNTVAGWSGDTAWRIAARKVAPMPYTVSLSFSTRQAAEDGSRNVAAVNADGFPDVFDPDFADNCARYARSATAAFLRDPYLVGYFLDNELKWWGEGLWFRAEGVSLVDGFLALPAEAPGKGAWVALLQQDRGYADAAAVDAAWGTAFGSWEAVAAMSALADDPAHPARAADKAAFLAAVARTYLEAADTALRAADPDHLDLCARVASSAPLEVFRAMAPCDVLTVNDYYTNDDDLTPDLFGGYPEDRWAAYALAAGGGTDPKPAVLTEFGLRATDSGMPNGMGAGFVGSTQADRGAYYRDVLDRLLGLRAGGRRFVVGFHWFEWRDEPKTGRWDGEDGNYGLMASDGSPYRPLWQAMASRHAQATDRLLGGTAPMLASPTPRSGTDGNGWPAVSWDPVPGAAWYEVRLAPAPWMPGEVLPSPVHDLLEQAPVDPVVGTGETTLSLPAWLPAGTWWVDVTAIHGGQAFPSVPSAPVALEVPRACTAADGPAAPGCFRNGAPWTSSKAAGWARTTLVQREGRAWMSLRFVANTLATSHPRNGGPGAELVLSWEPPAPLAAGDALPGLCAGTVVGADGARGSAARFLRLRLRGPDGAVVADAAMDPEGTLSPGACLADPGTAPSAVARLEWVLPTADPDLPLDVPVEVLAGPFSP